MLEAVILAGGKGTRLRPLTLSRPKPMLPVGDLPLLEHVVHLLRRHGYSKIGVTLQYMPWAVQTHFGDGRGWGVSLTYAVETEPRGTAGSVKVLEDRLNDTFTVISGDALTDFDLGELGAFHRASGALVTMALARVDDPSQYGVVELDGRGRVVRFLEKPAPGEAFSNLVNTGIYVLDRRVLAAVPAGVPFDFSRELFPLLLARGEKVFGCALPGYWRDIGTPDSYRQANADVAAGRVAVEAPADILQAAGFHG